MKAILLNLIELQRIDNRIFELVELRGDLPFKVQNLQENIEKLTEENSEKSSRISELESELRGITSRMEDNTIKLKHYKDQLYLVTTNKEYDALLSEIDTMKNSVIESENKIIEFEQEKTELQELVKSNELKIESSSEDLKNSKEELSKSLSETEVEEKDLTKRRKGFISKIDANYLANYEKLKEARDGIAVSPISRSSCGSCYNFLPPQSIIEIKRNNNLINCPSCGVFLFWEEEEE
ncbi:MAG: hypothetical protein ISR90_02435 [Candidatus Marinimicrobia bacterium]|nr:hypothetical protein [Candidatus Neomarinimicrobiota bacterium]MBL7022898.1 hypothetical protein [Candidatus Neomarinimicrobiota bacterium]MBL7109217.1 hypothetical protein [Candidatus Neomarinimicrobiota bacterium]